MSGQEQPRSVDPWTEYIDAALIWRPLQQIELPRNARVLDLGCGDGRIAAQLSAQGFRALGVDLMPGMGSRVLARAEALPFPDSTFDGVLLILALMHIRSQQVALREIRRVLKDEGVLVVAVGNRRSFTALAFREQSARFLNRKVPYDYYLSYSAEELSGLLDSTGFNVTSIDSTTFVPRVLGKASPALVRELLALGRPIEDAFRRLPGIRLMGIRLVAIAEARPA